MQHPDSHKAGPGRMTCGVWRAMGRDIPLGDGLVMGILNATPDSFSDGGSFLDPERAVDHALELVAQGAAVIDVGGESTRPGAEPVGAEEERRRVLPVIRELARQRPGVPISIDTTKSAVAEAALDSGASIINDISALSDPAMGPLAARSGAGVVLMHMRGTPRTMQIDPGYEDAPAEIGAYLKQRAAEAVAAGINPLNIALDPGIGFGKRVADNLDLLAATPFFAGMGFPLLLGFSRKSFIGKVLGEEEIGARYWPTVALCALCQRLGARIFRVHDVAPCLQAIRMAAAIGSAEASENPKSDLCNQLASFGDKAPF